MQSKEQQMKGFVINLLEINLPEFYYYHNVEHTLYVLDKAMEIAKQEKCSPEEIRLLYAAVLWHDTGYLKTYAGHEEESCKLARQYLPAYGYSTADINKICGMIIATKTPQSPQNKSEEIIADADLEYLGTELVGKKTEDLFEEMLYLNPGLTKSQWNHAQVLFLQQHHYFTKYCKERKEPVKQEYLNKLIRELR